MIGRVTSDPDGVLTAPKGAMVTDTTTGVVYQNEDGSTSWWPRIIPPRRGWSLCDEALNPALSTYTAIGGGTWASSSVTSGNPGWRTATVSAAGTDGGVMRAGGGSLLQLGGGVYRFRTILKIPTLSDGTNNIIVRAGCGDATIFGDNTDGVYFEYDFATNGDHKWRYCAISNTTKTKVDTGILATTNWVVLSGIVNAAASQATGKIDDVAVTPVSSNLPSSAGRQIDAYNVAANKQLGAGALTLQVDLVEACQILTTAR